MAEGTINSVSVDGKEYPIEDTPARTRAGLAYDIGYEVTDHIGKHIPAAEPKDLADAFSDDIESTHSGDEAAWFKAKVESGDFSGLAIGDYFDITLSDQKTFRYRIGAFDPYLKAGEPEETGHHVIMIPSTVWPEKISWNKSASNNNGDSTQDSPYLKSDLHDWEVNTYFNLLPQKWKSAISPHRALIETRYSASSSLTESNGDKYANLGNIFSLSEVEVMGFNVYSGRFAVGYNCMFPIFDDTSSRMRKDASGTRCHWWQRDVSQINSTHANGFDLHGKPFNFATNTAGVNPLPCFRIGK